MSDGTNPLNQVSQSAIQRETTINGNFAGASPAMMYMYNPEASSGLTWAYIGGRINGTSVANGTVTLTNTADNYIVAHRATFAVSVATNTTNWNDTATYMRLYKVPVAGGAVTTASVEDHRLGSVLGSGGTGGSLLAGGSDTQVQYNDGGTLAGEASLVWNKTDNILTAQQFAVNSSNVNAQSGTSYTLLSTDNGKIVTLSNGSAITLEVPAGLGAGFSCMLIQIGTGQVTITPDSTTVNSVGAALKISAQYGAATLFAYASNTFVAAGALTT